MAQGKIRWFNRKRGYGFIDGDGGPDIFLHFSDVQGDGLTKLKDGDLVEYEVVQGEKGPRAAKVIRKDTADES